MLHIIPQLGHADVEQASRGDFLCQSGLDCTSSHPLLLIRVLDGVVEGR